LDNTPTLSKSTNLQEVRFASTWSYIAQTPLYKKKLDAEGIDVGSINCLADLQKVPFSYKSELRSTPIFERSPLRVEQIYAIYSSGGTSGKATLYVWNEEDVDVQKDVSRRVFRQLGVNASDIALILAPVSLPVMGHCMIRQYEAAGASFIPLGPADPATVSTFIQQLPVTLVATLPVVASRLNEFMRYSQNISFDGKIHIRQFHFGGDYLSTARRNRLQTSWNAKCYDMYGISELFGPVSGECALQNGLHFADDYIYMEILDPETKQPVPDGERGVAVYTTLWKKGFPLLRYWSDDYITRDSHPCACGLPSPRIFYHGRTLDYVRSFGKIYFVKDIEEVVLKFPVSDEYFIEYKEDKNGYAELQVEPIPGYEISQTELADAIGELLHLHVKVQINRPGSLPREVIKPKRLINFPNPIDFKE